jgi:hypothetical protein
MRMFTFVETRFFSRLADEYLGDDGLLALQVHLLAQPELGEIVPGSGGVRKLRWAMPGRGKRGGMRVIYFLRLRNQEIWLLTLYPKNVVDNIPAGVLRKIREAIDAEKESQHR